MPDINLIEDRGVGDEDRERRERAKRAQPGSVPLSNPQKSKPTSTPPVPKPAGPSWIERLRALLAPAKTKKSSIPVAPKILEQKVVTKAARVPEPVQRTASPVAPLRPTTKARQFSPSLQSDPTVSRGNVPGVNLVPQDLLVATSTQSRLVVLGFITLITVLVLGAIYLVLSLVFTRMKNEAQDNTKQVTALQQQMASLQKEEKSAQQLHTQTLAVQQLLSTHIYWTKFFAGLEKYTVDTVYYRGMTADRAGRVTLAASTRDFRSVARQLVAFRGASDFVKDVTITSATTRTDGNVEYVDFSATLTLDDDVFYRDSSGRPDFTTTTPTTNQ